MVNGSYDSGPPRPPTDVTDFGRLVPADTEEPLPDQLQPSLDCHGPVLVKTPPSKKLPNNDALTDLSFTASNQLERVRR